MEKLNINQWAAERTARGKMMQKGAEALSDAELLLAILIGSGNTEETAVTLIAAHTRRHQQRPQPGQMGGAGFLDSRHGPRQSITVMASLELGKRHKLQERSGRAAIRSSADIYELFHPALRPRHRRILGTAYEPHRQVIDKGTHQRGGIDSNHRRRTASCASPCCNAPHNSPHPATIPPAAAPSSDDQRLTELVRKAAQTMNIHA